MTPKEDFTLKPERIRRAVRSAGFQMEDLVVQVRGQVRARGEKYEIELGGSTYEVRENDLFRNNSALDQDVLLSLRVVTQGDKVVLEPVQRSED